MRMAQGFADMVLAVGGFIAVIGVKKSDIHPRQRVIQPTRFADIAVHRLMCER